MTPPAWGAIACQAASASASPPDTPTAFTVTSALSTVIMNWTPAGTGGQAERFKLLAAVRDMNAPAGTVCAIGILFQNGFE